MVRKMKGVAVGGSKEAQRCRGCEILSRRWVMERTFAWLGRQRRPSKDYERKIQTSETLIQITMT